MNTKAEIAQIKESVLCVVRAMEKVADTIDLFSKILNFMKDWIMSAEAIQKEMVQRENELEKRIAVLESKLYHNKKKRHGHQKS